MPSKLLYIDESGEFLSQFNENAAENRGRRLLGAVLLTRAISSLSLKHAISRACPGVPWPPHAAHMNTLSFRPVMVHGRRNRELSQRAPRAVHNALCALKKANPPALRQVISEQRTCKKGRYASLQHYQALDGWIRAHLPEHRRALSNVVSEQRDALSQLLEAHRSSIWVVASVIEPGPPSPDDYATAFRNLLKRVERGFEGVQLIVTPAAFPSRAPLKLNPLLSDRLRAEGSLVAKPMAYNHRAQAGLVLADFVANTLRRQLRGSWSELHRRLAFSGLHVIGPDGVPLISCAGEPQRWLEQTLHGKNPPPLARPSHWSAQQAALCVQVLNARGTP